MRVQSANEDNRHRPVATADYKTLLSDAHLPWAGMTAMLLAKWAWAMSVSLRKKHAVARMTTRIECQLTIVRGLLFSKIGRFVRNLASGGNTDWRRSRLGKVLIAPLSQSDERSSVRAA